MKGGELFESIQSKGHFTERGMKCTCVYVCVCVQECVSMCARVCVCVYMVCVHV